MKAQELFHQKATAPWKPDNIQVLQSLASELDMKLVQHTSALLFTYKCPVTA